MVNINLIYTFVLIINNNNNIHTKKIKINNNILHIIIVNKNNL